MASTVAWLDTSADEQRKVRDLIALFSQAESRDELGIGQIRDSLSDLLFPGTSVLQTRARYFLIVPWAFQRAARKRTGRLADDAHLIERQLVSVLAKGGDEGVIGRVAGAAVKNLPSAVFWSGLTRYRILTRDTGQEQLTGIVNSPLVLDASDELAERRVGDWHPTLPPAPEGFPWQLPGGLELTRVEAEWLRDRIVEYARGTMLEHLLVSPDPPDNSRAPWTNRSCLNAPEQALKGLRAAQAFSLMIHGASLLYNWLVAERYVDEGFTRVEDPIARYAVAYADWLGQLNASASALAEWTSDAFWALVDPAGTRVSFWSREFVNSWVEAVRSREVEDALSDPGERLKRLIGNRERSIKKTQSRLTNAKLLGGWSGASGTGQLVYRWPQVRRIVADIHDGLRRA